MSERLAHDSGLDGPGSNRQDADDLEYEYWHRSGLVNTNIDDVYICADCPGSTHWNLVRSEDAREHWREAHRREAGDDL